MPVTSDAIPHPAWQDLGTIAAFRVSDSVKEKKQKTCRSPDGWTRFWWTCKTHERFSASSALFCWAASRFVSPVVQAGERWEDSRWGLDESSGGSKERGRREEGGSDGSLWSPSTWISAGINCRIHYQHWKSNEIYKARGPQLRRRSPTAGQGPGMSLAMRCRADGSDRQIAGIRRLDC